MSNTKHRIYPIYICRSRQWLDNHDVYRTDVYEQDVVAFSPTRVEAEVYVDKLNTQHEHVWEVDGETRRVYFTIGHGRKGIVSLPKAITLVG